jgi:hypothetical protein
MKTAPNDIAEVETRLSPKTRELFLCLYQLLKGVVPSDEIQITSDTKDFVRIKLESKNGSKLKYSFDLYNNGWYDFFLDGTEIMQMAEFKSLDEAKEYFHSCLTSPVKRKIVKNDSGKVLKTDYFFVRGDRETLASGEISLSALFTKTECASETFSPWIEKK